MRSPGSASRAATGSRRCSRIRWSCSPRTGRARSWARRPCRCRRCSPRPVSRRCSPMRGRGSWSLRPTRSRCWTRCAARGFASPPAWVLIDAAADDEAAGYLAFGPLHAQASAAAPVAHVEAGDLLTLMYTSGTTGLPKGIQHTHFIRAMYATTMANAWRMAPESVVLHSGAHRVQRGDDDDVPGVHARRDVRAASRVRRGGVHRDGRARARHAHDAGAVADHRHPQRAGVRRRRGSRRCR